MKPDRHYRGDNSKNFWERINQIPSKTIGKKHLYRRAVYLHNLEEEVLAELERVEELSRKQNA